MRNTPVRIAGAACMLAAIAISLEAMTFTVRFLVDPVGPKGFPLLTAGALFLGGLWMLVGPGKELSFPDIGVHKRQAVALGTMVLYTMALPVVGFVSTTTGAMVCLAWLFGESPRRSVFYSLLFAAGIFLLFAYGLNVPLPIGTLWIKGQ